LTQGTIINKETINVKESIPSSQMRNAITLANAFDNVKSCEARKCSREKHTGQERYATFKGRMDKNLDAFMKGKITKAAFMKESTAIQREALSTSEALALQKCSIDKCRDEIADLVEKALSLIGHECNEKGKKGARCKLMKSVQTALEKGDIKVAYERIRSGVSK
jgi:hypothetical protein